MTFQWSYAIFALIGVFAAVLSVISAVTQKIEPPEHIRVSEETWYKRNRIADCLFALSYLLFGTGEFSHMINRMPKQTILILLLATAVLFVFSIAFRAVNNRKVKDKKES